MPGVEKGNRWCPYQTMFEAANARGMTLILRPQFVSLTLTSVKVLQ